MTGIEDDAIIVMLYNASRESFLADSPSAAPSAAPSQSVTTPSPQQAVLNISTQTCQVGSFKGYLSFEVSQQEFYVQKTADTELLESVTAQVQEQAGSAVITSPIVGQACIAKFKDDGAWYRAEIKSVSDSEVMVLFVDFGNSSSVDKSDILVITEELSKIPAIAMACGLTAENPEQNLTSWAAGK